jgi:N-formylglutamate deformylase
VGFRVTNPIGREIPVIVEIPHASVWVDPESLGTLSVPARCIGQDADLFVDQLYDKAPALGATVLIAEVSRYVCDLNRSEADVDPLAVVGAATTSPTAPHGLIWRRSTDGQNVLHAPLQPSEFNRRLVRFYRPYHEALTQLVHAKLERFGFVIVLAAHSMPSSGRAGHTDSGNERADIVPGSRGGTTAASELIRTPEELARKRGWSVVHDQPYRGGFTTGHWGQPSRAIHALQVELNRRLYMDEVRLVPVTPGFEQTRDYCTDLVARLGQIDLSPRIV